MPARWRVETFSSPQILVEVCWRPMEGDEAGDFHDVIDLRTGAVGVAIGDVAGFGAAAAERAEELRTRWRRAFRVSDQPHRVLELLDRQAAEVDPELFATVACAVVDPVAELIHVSNAGHPPIMSAAGSETRYLNGLPDPPIGLDLPRRLVSYQQHRGAMLLLYTDGLIERRGSSIEAGFEVLLESARQLSGETGWASQLARLVTARLGQPADDATVVALRLLPVGPLGSTEGQSGRRDVTLRVYLDPADLRSPGTEAVVREVARRVPTAFEVEVQVVDITSPDLAGDDEVIAAPTVLRVTPAPKVQVVGGLRTADELARALNLPLVEEQS